MTTLLGPFSQLLTLDGLPMRGAIRDEQLHIREGAYLLLRDQQIVGIGSQQELLDQLQVGESHTHWRPHTDAVVVPGLIDCHTHICFAGSRARDFAWRNGGSSYMDIARAGGGIQDSVRATRAASEAHLIELTRERAARSMRAGVTTIEVKSGYGLNVEQELKQLQAIRRAARSSGPDMVPTCLAAHVVPKDFDGSPADYLDYVVAHLFPKLGAPLADKSSLDHYSDKPPGAAPPPASPLTNRIDVFIEEEAFTPELSLNYLLRAKAQGFDLCVHADQFSPGGAKVAVEVGARSADHLEASRSEDIQLLAQSDTVAVALPGCSLGLGIDFAPARRLLDAGAILAVASDWNPGSAPMGDLVTQAAILATYQKLSCAEVLAGMTYRAARALGLNDRGRLKAGMRADLAIFPTADYRDILYYQGQLRPSAVWVAGQSLHQSR